MKPVLYDYWRSSASYRVRIALNLLGIAYEAVSVDLLKKEQLGEAHLSRNPQGLVPALEIDGQMLTQSLAIIEYLNETRSGSLMPGGALERARVHALAYIIAMEIHPVCNLSIVADVMERTGGGDAVRSDWMQKYIRKGLVAFEARLGDGQSGEFCHGDTPTMADICLVPQLYNANRWGAETADLARINAIAGNCAALEPFAAAHPDRVGPSG
ncbi:maleylacetoacetate isomerase [Nitratireductor sp. XY-223]|uniref:maleylacetoacetate isomerase n=1 Tax=Nitratireductor sp. XY-223 TaxID=2561926 RepID=UPI0010AA8D2F|nr:maleylacetoacetate isomerase [Nitratireductor sp. XY-223]